MNSNLSSFFRRHLLLLASIFIMTFGLALFLRSHLGSSAISSMPFALSIAGADGSTLFGLHIPALSVGAYTIIYNAIFVLLQLIILCRHQPLVSLLKFLGGQLIIGAIFSLFIDLNMFLTSPLEASSGPNGFVWGLCLVIAAGITMGFGVACEVRCHTIMMPGEGLQVAIAQVLNREFSKVKIIVDTTLVALAIILCFIFWGSWQWHIVGIGTLVSMIFVGLVVRFFQKRLQWFDALLALQPSQHLTPSVARNQQDNEPDADANINKDIPLVITIARQYGSGGLEVGRKIADRLGIQLFDKSILDNVAQNVDLQPHEIEQREQNISNARFYEMLVADNYVPRGTVLSKDDKIYVAQSRFIRSVASKEPCVIIGRLADHILKDRPNVIRIFILSSPDFAAKRLISLNPQLTLSQALDKISQVNTARANHSLRYAGRKWADPANYDIVFNTSTVQIDRVVDVVCALVLDRQKLKSKSQQ